MPRIRLLVSVLCCASAAIVLGVAGHGQTPATSPRTVLDRLAPAPIERGIIAAESRAPDSADSFRRRSTRLVGGGVDRSGALGARYVPGRVIVKFKDGATPAARAASLAVVSRTASMSARASYADFDVVQIDPAEDAESVARRLSERPDVDYAQAAYRMHTLFAPNDTFYRQQWNLPLIGMERAWDIQPQAGSTVTVAIIDTGMAYTNITLQFHANAFQIDDDGFIEPPDGTGTVYPALGNVTLAFVPATQLVSPGRIVAPYDFIWDDAFPVDLDGHGTHVAGTVGQITNDGTGTAGVAFNVKLMPVKAVDGVWDDIFGSPNVGTDDVVARGIRYAADHGARILNLSVGRSGPPAPVVEAAIRYAVGRGAFVAVAAGNGFEEDNPTEVLAEIASRVQGAVSVAAVDSEKQHAYYSGSGNWVELAAPGGSFREFGSEGGVLQQTLDLDMVETYRLPPDLFKSPKFDSLAYFYFVGTSQSTPHVSGVAAMLLQQGVTSPGAIEAALELSATDLGTPGRDPFFGFGLIEARATLRGLGLAR